MVSPSPPPAAPDPRPAADTAPDPPPPVRSLEIAVADEVLELAALRDGPGVLLLVLGRRSLGLYHVGADEARLRHAIDLTGRIPPAAVVDRQARACLQFLPSADGSTGPWLHLFSTALGTRVVGEAAFRLVGGRLEEMDPIWLQDGSRLGACDAFLEGWRRGWQGRTLVLPARRGGLFFHLNDGGRLAVAAGPVERQVFEWPSGDLLTSHGASRRGTLYVSSMALPGELDHVAEYGWDGHTLEPLRRSREFQGRLAAMTLLPGDPRAAVAQVVTRGASRIHILGDDELWQEAAP